MLLDLFFILSLILIAFSLATLGLILVALLLVALKDFWAAYINILKEKK